jgi:hypothetical protein
MTATSALIEVLKTAAETSDDVIQVTSAVAALDGHGALDVERLRPRAGLHPQWVLSQQAADVAHAIFATRYCYDEAALDTIAHTTTRITVLREVVNNRHASNATKATARAKMNARQAEARPAQARRAAPNNGNVPVPAEFDVFGIRDVPQRYPLMHFNERAVRTNATPELLDAFIDFACTLDRVSTVKKLFSDCYSRPYDGPVTPVWAIMGRHPVDVLNLLPVRDRTAVLGGILNMGYYQGRRPNMYWDLTLAKAIVAHASVTTLSSSRTPPGEIFTPSAYTYIITQPEWRKLALAHLPNSRQLKTLLRTMASEDLGDTENQKKLTIPLQYFSQSRNLFITARDYRGPGRDQLPENALSLENAAEVSKGPDDELFVKAIEVAPETEIAKFLGCGLEFSGDRTRLYPAPADLPALAGLLGGSKETAEILRDATLYEAPPEYVEAASNLVPTLWECAIVNQIHHGAVLSQLLAQVTLNKVSAALARELAPMTLPQVIAYLR